MPQVTSNTEISIPKGKEAAICPNCNCTWFEHVTVQQYDKLHAVILGQTVPPVSPVSFFILRCIKCNEILEPNILAGTRDSTARAYDSFLDQLEADMPTKEELKPTSTLAEKL
jgi:hypothetical protein